MATEIEVDSIFGAWKVLSKLDYGQKYACLCTACGTTNRNIRVYDLTSGKTLMCKSCARSNRGSVNKPIEYNSWVAMNQRCHNPNSKDYKNYGGRGFMFVLCGRLPLRHSICMLGRGLLLFTLSRG